MTYFKISDFPYHLKIIQKKTSEFSKLIIRRFLDTEEGPESQSFSSLASLNKISGA